MKRIHIIGRKNSGKTTLMVELVGEMSGRGYRVGTIKHTHHEHELDSPGKDSHRHRLAGSAAVGILTKHMDAVFLPKDDVQNGKSGNQEKYDRFDSVMKDCDVVLVEGDSQVNAIKLEVFRCTGGEQPIACTDAAISAVITDDSLDLKIPIWKRSDLKSIVQNIEQLLNLEHNTGNTPGPTAAESERSKNTIHHSEQEKCKRTASGR